ncbi:MAG TPA: NepR family anti-sigma factor [Lichenihabitans sp.]|nr:NepR family anti-sigma factor [Lichenihabitans sp.]
MGRQLRAVYDDVARQPVPDRFLELMKKLESAGH